MTFPCTKCGACCRRAGLIPGFPHPAKPDGSCSKLVGNECSIYADRPDICRISVALDRFSALGISRDDFIISSAKACNQMQDADRMPKTFRVKLD